MFLIIKDNVMVIIIVLTLFLNTPPRTQPPFSVHITSVQFDQRPTGAILAYM